MANSLIDLTLKEIAAKYQPGALSWMKENRPEEWAKMLTLEGEMNKTALGGDPDGLRGALNSYRGLILAMLKKFKIKEERWKLT
jgi:hypothetical protein